MSIEIKEIPGSNLSYVTHDSGVYTFEIMNDKLAFSSIPFFTNGIKRMTPMRIGNIEFIPLGDTNRMPDELRLILDEDNTTPGILQKKVGLLWGQGPCLYKTEFIEGVRKRVWIEDYEIQSWLDSFDYVEYLMKAAVEYNTMNSHFTRYYRNVGYRIGQPGKIAKIEHVSCRDARLGWPDSNRIINYIVAGDFDRPWINGVREFPYYDPANPFANPISMNFSSLYSFALDNDYPRPTIFGNINWMKTANSIAKILLFFNQNSAAIKYHIKSPAKYWSDLAISLQRKCIEAGSVYTDKMLEDAKKVKVKEITKALSGIEMAGKAIHTESIYDDDLSQYVDWIIEAVDGKIKDFVDAQIAISKRAVLEKTTGLDLHPALSNISSDGNLPSGSELLYAFKLYLHTSTEIPERIVCKDLNYAIRANFPAKQNIKIGFYHDTILVEEQTNPKDRVKNKQPNQ